MKKGKEKSKDNKITCQHCHDVFLNKMAYGGHIKNCTAKKYEMENIKKIIDSLRPLKASKLPPQPKNENLYKRGWKDVAKCLKVSPRTAMRMYKRMNKMYKRASRKKQPMPIFKIHGRIMFNRDDLVAWRRGEFKS